ncbi:MAG: glycosyltransferase [Muribaculaceae bacterium]|nr:glycosyltransferase [Muribaculaceae bacterium]
MVSVCLATYNGELFIKEQIQSIIPELENEDEIIISDDGSTDNTLPIIRNFKDSRIKIFINKETQGVNNNMENAIRKASGDIIFLSDQDNVWIKGKIEKCVKALENYDCVIHDCIVTNNELTPINNSIFKDHKPRKGFLRNLYKNSFTGCCMAFKKETLFQILPFPNSKKFYYDQWIGLRIAQRGKIKLLQEPLLYLRRHNHTLSSVGRKSTLSIICKISYRLILLRYLLTHKPCNR